MAKETGSERAAARRATAGTTSSSATASSSSTFYREAPASPRQHAAPRACRRSSPTRRPRSASRATSASSSSDIDELDWYSAKDEGLGDLYEGLLEKNAEETKSGAGQYFTPRPLIDCMVELHQAPGRRARPGPRGGHRRASSSPPTATSRAQTDDLFDLRRREAAGFQISARPSTASSSSPTPSASR